MEVEGERSLLITKKKWEGWGAKPYGAARGGRKNVVPVRGNAEVCELVDSFGVNPERNDLWEGNESNSGAFADAFAGAFAGAFADEKIFLMMQLMLPIVTIYPYMHEI